MTEKDKTIAREPIRRATRIVGLYRAAEQAGCTPSHLSRVLHGERKPGPRLRRKLERMGIELPAAAEAAGNA